MRRLEQNPLSISFETKEGLRVRPSEVFRLLYEPLDVLINFNIQTEESQRHRRSRVKTPRSPINLVEWINSREQMQLTATICYGTEETRYAIDARTNFDQGAIEKRPSIAILRRDDEPPLFLREARTYSLENFVIPRIAEKANRTINPSLRQKRFDIDATRQFYENSDEDIHAAQPEKLMYVPEPHILCALEEIYADDLIHRITPQATVIDHDDQTLWLLRDYVQIAGDIKLGPELLGRYLATMHALGLTEFLDRQLIHYCAIGNHIGNFDVDFMLHTTDTNIAWYQDLDDVKVELGREGKKFGSLVDPKEYIKLLRKQIRTVSAEYEANGVGPTLFLSYLHRTVKPDALSRLELKL